MTMEDTSESVGSTYTPNKRFLGFVAEAAAFISVIVLVMGGFVRSIVDAALIIVVFSVITYPVVSMMRTDSQT